jgi:hypothetical protein
MEEKMHAEHFRAIEQLANEAQKLILDGSEDVFFSNDGIYIKASTFESTVHRIKIRRGKRVANAMRDLSWEMRYICPFGEFAETYVFSPTLKDVHLVCPELITKSNYIVTNATHVLDNDPIKKEYHFDGSHYTICFGKKQYRIAESIVANTCLDSEDDWIFTLMNTSPHWRLQNIVKMLIHGEQLEVTNHDYPKETTFKLYKDMALVFNPGKTLVAIVKLSEMIGTAFSNKLASKVWALWQMHNERVYVLKMGVWIHQNIFHEVARSITPNNVFHAELEIEGEPTEGYLIRDKSLSEWFGWYTTHHVKIKNSFVDSYLKGLIDNGYSNPKGCIGKVNIPQFGDIYISEHALNRFMERNEINCCTYKKQMAKLIKRLSEGTLVKRANSVRQLIKHNFQGAKYVMHGEWIFVVDEKNILRTCYSKGVSPLKCGYKKVAV